MTLRRMAGRWLRHLPVTPRSYLTPGRPTRIPPARWDAEYRAGHWERFGSLAEVPRYAIIGGFCGFVDPAARVLDVGCGNGMLHAWLTPDSQRRYVGIDVSAEAVAQARDRARQGAPDFAVADAASYVPQGRFGVVVFNEMLYYLDDPAAVLARYAACLAPDGAYVISLWHATESLVTWRRCAAALTVHEHVSYRVSGGTGWHVRLCRPA